jgi:hypothetical protein
MLVGLLFSGLCRGRLDCWVADVSIAMLLSSSELVKKLLFYGSKKTGIKDCLYLRHLLLVSTDFLMI